MATKRFAEEMVADGGADSPFDVCDAMASAADSALTAIVNVADAAPGGGASESTFKPAIESFLHEVLSSTDVEFETWLSQAKRQQEKTGVINGENLIRAIADTTTQLLNEVASTYGAMVQAGE